MTLSPAQVFPTPKATNQPSLGTSELTILRALGRYHFMTSQQVCRLAFSRGSLTYVQTRLKGLADAGYCQRMFLPSRTRTGSAPSVYSLARGGLRLLQAEGAIPDQRFRPSEHREHAYLFLAHTLAVNDFLIALELFCRANASVSLEALLHERTLKLEPMPVQVDGRRVAVIPDGWFELILNGAEQMCVSLEIDRGTLEQREWRRRIRALLTWAKGPYQERFGTTSLTIATVATPGAGRHAELLRWTEAELEACGQTSDADLFRFAYVRADIAPPEQVFLGAEWVRPFEAEPLPLVDLRH